MRFVTRWLFVLFKQIRSEIIATYALCGFANLASVGVQLGGLGPMAPSRIPDMSRVAIRALIAGTVACFMTACVAGKVFSPFEPNECQHF